MNNQLTSHQEHTKSNAIATIQEKGTTINVGIGVVTLLVKDSLIMLAPLLTLLSSIMLTVDIVVRGGLATSGFFQFAWAIVQAISIEGLLFATWFHIIKHIRDFKNDWLPLTLSIVICTVMTLVDIGMFVIAMSQGMHNIGDSLTAMSLVGINPVWFMYGRAVLAVLTPFLSIPFGYSALTKQVSMTVNRQSVSLKVDTFKVTEVDSQQHTHHLLTEPLTLSDTDASIVNDSQPSMTLNRQSVSLKVDSFIDERFKITGQVPSVTDIRQSTNCSQGTASQQRKKFLANH